MKCSALAKITMELTSQLVDEEIREAAMNHFTGLRFAAAEARAEERYEEMRLAA